MLSDDGKTIREVNMEKNMIYIVEEWHNAHRPGGCEGVALVIEAPDIKTVYREIKRLK